MCKETIAVGICAPNDPSTLTFTCGKLHLIASSRRVCDDAIGSCVCFFGSCGKIEKITSPDAFELGDISKARCVACTAREDQVGERRHGSELAESPLLVRSAIQSPVALAHFEMDIKILWNHAKECPFHGGGRAVSHSVNPADYASADSFENHPEASQGSQSPGGGVPLPTASSERDSYPPKSSSETLVNQDDDASQIAMPSEETNSGLALNVGLVTSRWAPSPTSPAPCPDDDKHRAKSDQKDGNKFNNEQGDLDLKRVQHTAKLLDGQKVSFLLSAKKFLERS